MKKYFYPNVIFQPIRRLTMKHNLISRFYVMFAAVAVVCTSSGVAMGEMLFLDSYNTSAQSTTGINFEIAGRTSGTYGGGLTTYNEYTDNNGTYAVGTEVLQLDGVSGKEYIWLNRNFNNSDSAGGLDVSFSAKLIMADADTKWFDITTIVPCWTDCVPI